MKVFVALVTLLVLGAVGFVALYESNKTAFVEVAGDSELGAIATITKGERVEIGPTVPRHGTTIIEFTAEF